MKLFNWHVPGTRDKDAEIERLERQLDEKDRELKVSESLRRKYFEEKIDASVALRQKEEAMVGQLRRYEEHSEQLKEKSRELKQEAEAYRTAFNALSLMQGLSPDLSQDRMLELARTAAQIQHDSNRYCSLSYELYAVQVCNEADRILPKLNEQEAKFFQAALGGDYTPPHERGEDWQSEHEIRQELYREMYGEGPDNDFDDDPQSCGDALEDEPEQTRKQQQGRGLSIGL